MKMEKKLEFTSKEVNLRMKKDQQQLIVENYIPFTSSLFLKRYLSRPLDRRFKYHINLYKLIAPLDINNIIKWKNHPKLLYNIRLQM